MTAHATLTTPDHNRLAALTRMRDTRDAAWQLQQQLRETSVVEPQKVDKDVVTMNSQVRLRDLKLRKSTTWTLVFPEDADMDAGKLSVLAPLGLAILGARVGQTIEVQTPGGRRRIYIDRILYQPEAAGDFHL